MEKKKITVEDLQALIDAQVTSQDPNAEINISNEVISTTNKKTLNGKSKAVLNLSNCKFDNEILFEHFNKIIIEKEFDYDQSNFNSCKFIMFKNITFDKLTDQQLSINPYGSKNISFSNCKFEFDSVLHISNADDVRFSDNCQFNISDLNLSNIQNIHFNNSKFDQLRIFYTHGLINNFYFHDNYNPESSLEILLFTILKNCSISIIKNSINSFKFQSLASILDNENKEQLNIINNFRLDGNHFNNLYLGACNFNTLNLLNDSFKCNVKNIAIELCTFEYLTISNPHNSKCYILIDALSKIKNLYCDANNITVELNQVKIENAKFHSSHLIIGQNIITRHNKDSIAISNTCQIELKEKDDIDTINILRHMFKDSNYHEYLQYNALSQNYLLEDKEGKLKCRDKILLWLNKHSNEFGTNWAKGVLFTVVTGCIFYCIALITHPFVFCFIDKPLPAVNCSQLNRVGMGFIEYITSADLFYSNENSINNTLKQSNFLTLLFYTLGKLSVMYGIYQTIQAFRKYRN